MIETYVMHVPGTRPFPTLLCETLSASIASDPYRFGPWANLRRILQWPRKPETTHVLVLNDDVLPTPGVVESVRAVAAYGRPAFVSLFSYHSQLAEAREKGVNWLQTQVFNWGCAQFIPVALIAPFLAFNAEYVRDDWDVDDTRWTLFSCYRKQPHYIFAPSLFDHPPGESVHRPGKSHRQTDWLSSGPITAIGDSVLTQREQTPEEYLITRKQYFKKECRCLR